MTDMESRKDIAAEKKASLKFNCAQAVLTTYSDLTGLDEATAMGMTDGFAAGMTNMEGTCGALVGADLVLGLANKDKRRTMKQMWEIMQKFEDRNHATAELYAALGLANYEAIEAFVQYHIPFA